MKCERNTGWSTRLNDVLIVSMVGLEFSDVYPSDLNSLLTKESISTVVVDRGLFDRYSQELTAFDSTDTNSVVVVPEPSVTLWIGCCILVFSATLRAPRRH